MSISAMESGGEGSHEVAIFLPVFQPIVSAFKILTA
jgi:hypothetical protein